ncbi:MAG: hypothetical protein NTZ44_03190 [Candidatus Nomurabacteria bacterium]|nr:hypothetical protein [Candidatus Nomurabacteria bacterium]
MVDRQKLSKNMAYMVFFILAINYIAIKLYLYWSVWYFDMPMHFLGGVFVGFLAIYLFDPLSKIKIFKINNGFRFYIFYIFLFTFIVGFGWEVFEVIFKNILAGENFNLLDTISDVCFDISGGFTTFMFFIRKNLL